MFWSVHCHVAETRSASPVYCTPRPSLADIAADRGRNAKRSCLDPDIASVHQLFLVVGLDRVQEVDKSGREECRSTAAWSRLGRCHAKWAVDYKSNVESSTRVRTELEVLSVGELVEVRHLRLRDLRYLTMRIFRRRCCGMCCGMYLAPRDTAAVVQGGKEIESLVAPAELSRMGLCCHTVQHRSDKHLRTDLCTALELLTGP